MGSGCETLTLYIERMDGTPSKLLERFELEQNLLEISFNLPDSALSDQHVHFNIGTFNQTNVRLYLTNESQ